MTVISRCTNCDATSYMGILTHRDSCVAAKPKPITGNIMPAIEVSGLDLSKLKTNAGRESPPMPNKSTDADGELDLPEFFRLASLIGCEPQDEVKHRAQLVEFVEEWHTKALKATAKAFGGCDKCFGKGYASYKGTYYARGSQWPDRDAMKFCSCDRGKELEKRFEATELRARIDERKKMKHDWLTTVASDDFEERHNTRVTKLEAAAKTRRINR